MIKVTCFIIGAFQVNTYLVEDEATNNGAIIDTGETTELIDLVQSRASHVSIKMILLTHAHLDHVGALSELQKIWNVPTYLPFLERSLFKTLPVQGTMFGMPHLNRPCGRIDDWIHDGDSIKLGDTVLHFLSTPGHTPGQGCYYNEDSIFVGDTIFMGGIGRTDLPMSNSLSMKESLRRLMDLPEHLIIYSGHGPITTIGRELKDNPFLHFIRKEKGLV